MKKTKKEIGTVNLEWNVEATVLIVLLNATVMELMENNMPLQEKLL